VGERTLTEAFPPLTLKTPMFATPEPVMVLIVPTGRASVGPAERTNPGPWTPRTPHEPTFWKAPASAPHEPSLQDCVVAGCGSMQ